MKEEVYSDNTIRYDWEVNSYLFEFGLIEQDITEVMFEVAEKFSDFKKEIDKKSILEDDTYNEYSILVDSVDGQVCVYKFGNGVHWAAKKDGSYYNISKREFDATLNDYIIRDRDFNKELFECLEDALKDSDYIITESPNYVTIMYRDYLEDGEIFRGEEEATVQFTKEEFHIGNLTARVEHRITYHNKINRHVKHPNNAFKNLKGLVEKAKRVYKINRLGL